MILRTLTFLLSFATLSFASELPGLYREDLTTTVKRVKSGKSETKERKISRLLELNKDHTLRFATKRKDKIRDYDQYQGAWVEHDGRFFYYMEGCGEYSYLTIGSSTLEKEGDFLKITSSVGLPFIRSLDPQLKSVDSLNFPIEIDQQKTTRMKSELSKVIKNTPSVKFEGRATEEEFIRDFHAAIKADDIATLMKLTSPQPNERIADVRLHWYLKYVSDLKKEGVCEIEDDKNVEKYVSMFAAGYSVKGHLKMIKKIGTASVGSYWFYGVVDGRWAFIGNPQRK